MGAWGRKVRKAGRFGAREIAEVRGLRPAVGIRRALAARARWNLELGSVPARLAALEGAQHVAPPDAADAAARAAADAALVQAGEARARLDILERISATTAWVDALPPSSTLISVIVPTHNRPRLVMEALASIRASTHESWEAIVVDDGSDEDTQAVLAAITDERVRVLRREEPSGGGAARNAGLAAARGEIIAYLDDDNLMGRHWLRAVAWAFDGHPETQVAFGALLHQRLGREPRVHFWRWNRRQLELTSITDQSAVAHRASVDGRQDEELRQATDWDQLLRLTADREPAEIPVVAVMYRVGDWKRVSSNETALEGLLHVQRAAVRGRPLRILGVNSMFPLVSEAYIHDELQALEQQGAQLAWWRANRVPAPMPVAQPVYDDLEHAVADFQPDVLMLHWASFATGQRARLEALGIPFAIRTHSLDQGTAYARELEDHPLCVGVWTYPSPGFDAMGTHALVPIFSSHEQLPEPPPVRDLVMSASACLPKKDFGLLFDAFDQLAGAAERRIVTGLTIGHEALALELSAMAAERADPPLVQFNLAREQVFALLARSAAAVYTLDENAAFGMPMSIVEALCAGACMIVPDRPECVSYAGPHARPYRSAHDIARHAREALAGGPAIDAEREENRAYALDRFCAPELGERFMEELLAGLDMVRARQAGFVRP